VGETLQSVLTQRDTALQVIVVDDGSTDDSAALVARDFPGVELVRSTNGGQCHARNVGLGRARGELLQFLDADDLLLPDKLAQQSARLERDDADIVYSDWRRVYDDADAATTQGENVVRALGDDPACELVRGNWSPPHAYMFRRGIVDKAGGFPERYWFTGDARFTIECALQGARFVHHPGVLALYRVHGKQLSQRDPRAFCIECLRSTQEVQTWWEMHDGITPTRHAALVEAYTIVARASYAIDRKVFWECYQALLVLEPRYVPSSPLFLRWASRIVGYPRAEALAGVYRQMKRVRATANSK